MSYKCGWWGYVKSMIRAYPKRRRCVSANGIEKSEKEAVEAAIMQTMEEPDGAERVRLIAMVYWRKHRFNIAGAALRIPCSEHTAINWHRDFVRLVAKNFCCNGLI